MRLFLLVLCFLVATSTAFADGSWHEIACDICEKRIYEYRESMSLTDGSNIITWDIVGTTCPWGEEQAEEVEYCGSLDLCQKCYKKYKKDFRESMKKYKNSWLLKNQHDNRELQEKHREETKLHHIKKLQKEIDELKKKVDELTTIHPWDLNVWDDADDITLHLLSCLE